MYSEQARREDYTIRRDDGTIYSPTLEDKSRFTVPNGRELHLVAHSNVPDEGNFPPHTQWIHLVFFDVFAQKIPGQGGNNVSTAIPGQSAEPPSPGVPSRPQVETSTNEAQPESPTSNTSTDYVVLLRRDGGNFVFDPPVLHLQPGDTVTWFNVGDNHTTTSYESRLPDGAENWDSGLLGFGDAGFTFSHTFSIEGTYDYFCLPHEFAGMVGRIVVRQPSGPAEGSDFSGIPDEAVAMLNSLPSSMIVSADGQRYNWAAAINLVLLTVFEKETDIASDQVQTLINNVDQLASLLAGEFDQFSLLLGEYLTLVQTNADLNELTQKSQELKTILFN
jgi:plastocyanin